MLTEISLQNFKLFREETRFPLGKITLLTGVNGRGKSTVLQPLLLMRQSIEHDSYTQSILLNGSCVHLGEVRDVKNMEAGEDEQILFKIRMIEKSAFSLFPENNKSSIHDDFEISYYLNNNKEFINLDIKKISSRIFDDLNLVAEEEVGYSSLKNIILYNLVPTPDYNSHFNTIYSYSEFFGSMHYVCADRLGPQDVYLRSNLGHFVNVGARGEHTATVLAQKQRELVAESLCLGEDARTVLQQTEEWLREIFGGAKLSVEVHRDFVDIGFNTRPDRNRYKPANVGFGYSYILPIIVSGLIAQPGELLIVENPEAHLHPRAQAALTRFLSKVAETGVQVFIESHSEHILNALRIVAKTPDIAISNTDISVLYFQDNDQEPFVPIPILPDGGIETWPQGFFDQTDKDYKELFGF